MSAELYYMGRIAWYTHNRSEEIVRELQIPHILEFMEQGRRNGKEHINGMSSDRILKKILKKERKKSLGRLLKGWKNCFIISKPGFNRPVTRMDGVD
jgi:hypothetical protein